MRARLAIPVAVGTVVLVVVGQALADPPSQVSPGNGATFTAGAQITFRAQTTTAPAPAHIDFYVSRDPDLDAQGVLANWFDHFRGFPTGGAPPVYEGAPDQDAGWPGNPDTYYWQAVNAGCLPDPALCESGVRSLRVTARPPPANPLLAAAVIPPQTYLKKRPRHKTRKRKVKFKFRSDVAGASFRCLFASGWEDCRSPHVFRRLKPGRYKFKAQAVVNGVEDPTPASWWFRVLRRRR